MYLLYAPEGKFGNIPSGQVMLTEEVKFYKNVAYCPKFYWMKMHLVNGCRDITPRFMKRLRKQRVLDNVVIFATGAIGDSMWAMPFVRLMRERNPQAVITVLVEKRHLQVWENFPYATQIMEHSTWNLFGLFHRADDVFDFGGVATVLKKWMKLDPIEAIFKYAEFPTPKDKEACRPHLIITIDEGRVAETILSKHDVSAAYEEVVCIGLHSSTSNRDWPLVYIVELTKQLKRLGKKVVWLGTNARFRENMLPADARGVADVNLTGKTNIRITMAMIALSNLYIGPNSSLMVISTALKIPTIGLFGAFDPKTRTKFYERFTALRKKVECAPCEDHWTECQYGHPAPCMKSLLPSVVLKESLRLLKKYPRHALEKLPIE